MTTTATTTTDRAERLAAALEMATACRNLGKELANEHAMLARVYRRTDPQGVVTFVRFGQHDPALAARYALLDELIDALHFKAEDAQATATVLEEEGHAIDRVAAAMAAAYDEYEAGRACSPSALDLVNIAADALGGTGGRDAVSTADGREFVADVLYDTPDVWEADHQARAAWLVAELLAE